MSENLESASQKYLERFFASHPDAVMERRAQKALHLQKVGGKPLAGRPASWAAGIIYFLANRDRQACGVPGMLNRDFEEFFHVSMGTIRRRAPHLEGLLDL